MLMAPDKIKLEKNYIKQSKNNNKKKENLNVTYWEAMYFSMVGLLFVAMCIYKSV